MDPTFLLIAGLLLGLVILWRLGSPTRFQRLLRFFALAGNASILCSLTGALLLLASCGAPLRECFDDLDSIDNYCSFLGFLTRAKEALPKIAVEPQRYGDTVV
jgi:hypothetical protein